MIGTCDICCKPNVPLSHGFACGIETFHCEDGCNRYVGPINPHDYDPDALIFGYTDLKEGMVTCNT